MANITTTTNLQLNKNDVVLTRNVVTQISMSGDAHAHTVKSVGFAAHEAVQLGSVTSVGVCFFKNLDATNFVQIGIDSTGTFVPFLKLKAGEAAMVRLATNAPYAKANTAAVKLESWVISD